MEGQNMPCEGRGGASRVSWAGQKCFCGWRCFACGSCCSGSCVPAVPASACQCPSAGLQPAHTSMLISQDYLVICRCDGVKNRWQMHGCAKLSIVAGECLPAAMPDAKKQWPCCNGLPAMPQTTCFTTSRQQTVEAYSFCGKSESSIVSC